VVRPTLSSVAAEAGVSRQTVSNVLNTPEIVHPDTTRRVRAAIDRSGYRPSRAARQLRTRRSMTIGLRLEPYRDGISGAAMDRFLHALVERAQALSYRVLLFTAKDDDTEIAAYADLLDDGDVDGVVLTGTHLGDPRTSWLAHRRVPFATFGRPWGVESPTHSWVDVDGAAGSRQAVEHLLAAGHRRIGFVGHPQGSGGAADDRRRGWVAALESARMADPGLARLVDDGVAAGAAAARDLLDLPEPPTALVCITDSLAVGAMSSGLPALAVVGFDDTPVAEAVGLSSLAQPLDRAAATCLDLVLSAIDEPGEHPQTVLLQPTLRVRTSSGPPDAPPSVRPVIPRPTPTEEFS
jgi:DNA-binding LacI/PurR family transcriptional regulator